ncbi:MAG: hypothetical protein ACRC10_07120 [Thermoguttaceae bacterium]
MCWDKASKWAEYFLFCQIHEGHTEVVEEQEIVTCTLHVLCCELGWLHSDTVYQITCALNKQFRFTVERILENGSEESEAASRVFLVKSTDLGETMKNYTDIPVMKKSYRDYVQNAIDNELSGAEREAFFFIHSVKQKTETAQAWYLDHALGHILRGEYTNFSPSSESPPPSDCPLTTNTIDKILGTMVHVIMQVDQVLKSEAVLRIQNLENLRPEYRNRVITICCEIDQYSDMTQFNRDAFQSLGKSQKSEVLNLLKAAIISFQCGLICENRKSAPFLKMAFGKTAYKQVAGLKRVLGLPVNKKTTESGPET